MKKKTMIVALVLSFMLGGVSTYAATKNYYAELLLNQKEQIQNELKEVYQERNKHTGKQVHNDMVMYVETKRQDILDEMHAYIDEKIGSDVNNRLNEHTKHVDEAADQLVKELKEYIDSLGETEND